MTPYDALVLAGGDARRLGGADKPAVPVGGRSLLDRVLGACAGARRTVVVGPRRATPGRTVVWTREEPPGGGPLPALAAGLAHTDAPVVAVLAADLPFLALPAIDALRAALAEDPDADAALLTDPGGRDQPLTAVYRAEPLRRELALAAAEYGTLTGLPLHLPLTGLGLRRLPAAEVPGADTSDCDTWADIAAARARIRDHGRVLDEWIAAVKTELGIDPDVDTTVLLDVARDAAHSVARPAAPLSTFLVGYAAALHGMSPAEAARKVAALAQRWDEESAPAGESPGQPGTGGAHP
ncbi:NTP transferase domain-containing protein [Streptomyces sp. RFCAC02]|uniref:NTP transferase domain-containing protein n=1 Tax=Streptomyces sp. RFCAC02 TaxID=2499143 RepID=UPI00101F568E|nr:NTP transferase domain-containing protein [Streptomyces sp. RFCAC02]